ncbi:hypothetical protein CHLRE_06g290150v5 [Chlamydomonas reinhardtii]|uniref:DUF7912 domain-containing protein n=1 Tax=Chlamydomonas reinhardtii TaxID=3055 RepID=A0A2K3DQ84_CHLRE|nr:uncharacterized protein CHLRE_06g290150v5 [Chlamydomonas reinhardtii]PNW82699.1 hypothetical protein CHLRE_06g290150v5 [Chlamydomonas reinhardtii]
MHAFLGSAHRGAAALPRQAAAATSRIHTACTALSAGRSCAAQAEPAASQRGLLAGNAHGAAAPQRRRPCSGRLVAHASKDKGRGADVRDPREAKKAAAAEAAKAREEQEEEEEDGYLDGEEGEDEFDEGEYEEGEDGEDEDEDGGDDYAASFLEPDDAPREVATGGTAWGEVVLKAAHEVLAQPNLQGLELYLFRALPSSRKVDIRLDKMDDLYGSPSIDDIEAFQRGLFAALDRELGVEAAGEISFEVSSPGAERLVRVPDELRRFETLPLKVEYRTPEGKDASAVLLLAELDEAAGTSAWRLANCRANATVKGRALSKRQLSQVLALPLADIIRVRIHVDF